MLYFYYTIPYYTMPYYLLYVVFGGPTSSHEDEVQPGMKQRQGKGRQ